MRTALVVEDNMIIALEIETLLEDLGMGASLITSTVESALAILAVRTIDFAILDMNLGFETSEEIADTLHARGVPFIFLTGYDEHSPMMRKYEGVPVLVKPFVVHALQQALERIGVR